MTQPDKLMDEAAMKVITDKLVDPWHRTFARDVVEMYLKHSYKHTEIIPKSQLAYPDGFPQSALGNSTQNPVCTHVFDLSKDINNRRCCKCGGTI